MRHSFGILLWGMVALTVLIHHAVAPVTMAGTYTRILEDVKAHKDLFPLDASDYWGTFFVFLGLMVAASGGVGGGGILVPLFILVYQFQPKYAVAMSNFTIVGSSVTNIVMNLSKRHPLADRPLVDWDLILVMEPLTMVGAIVGAFASQLLPDWLLTSLLVLLLAFTTWTTLEKGQSQWNRESKMFADRAKSLLQQAQDAEVELAAVEENKSLLSSHAEEEEAKKRDLEQASSSSSGSSSSSSSSSGEVEGEGEGPSTHQLTKTSEEAELAQLIDSERNTPTDKAIVLSGMVIAVIVLNLLKGGDKTRPSPLGIECGGYGYWGIQALVVVIVLIVTVWARNFLIEKWRLKRRLRYKYISGDVEWNERNTIIYPCICFFAGLCAGMFGIGGGIVKGPLMLQMGVHPQVASNTCAVMIMFTSVAATAMFIAFGTLTWDYGIFLFVVGLISTALGQYVVSYLVEKYERVSLVTISIGAVVLLSTILMSVQSIMAIVDFENKPPTVNTLC